MDSLHSTIDRFKELYESMDWKLITRVDKFEVFKKPGEGGKHVILARGEFDHPAQKISDFAVDCKHMSVYDKVYSRINLLDTLPEGT